MTHLTMLLAQMDPQALKMQQEINAQMQSISGPVNLVGLVFYILVVVGWWKLFAKAGKPGWAAIIPIYNLIVLMEIIGRPVWWVLLYIIPCVGFIVHIIVAFDTAKCYGKGAGYGLGLALLPMFFYPLLGFSDAQYLGPISK